MKIPKSFAAGDTVSWLDSPWLETRTSSFVKSGDYQLLYELRGATQLTAVTSPQGDGWFTILAGSATATLQAGIYVWGAYIISASGDRRSVGGGTILVTQNLSAVNAPIDPRSMARKALDDCETALATFNKSGGKIKSYSIGSRQTEFHSLQDLMMLRDFWQRKVNKENEREAIRNGRGNPRNLRVRFR